VNIRGKYADGLYNSMIDDKDGYIPFPLIMVTCTTLHHAHLEWQKIQGVHPKASKSTVKAGKPDRPNYFNCKNESSKIVSCCAVTGYKVVNLVWCRRYRKILDEFLEHSTGELPTDAVSHHYLYRQGSGPTEGEPNACRGDQHEFSAC
jgi:hypothetical protein